MKVVFTPRARRHLEAIAEYVAERNPAAAVRVGSRIRETIDLLGKFPTMGRNGILEGTREFVVTGLPYIVVYRAGEDVLTILGVYHGAQRRPGQAKR
jgi:plasmid stabilization system protein ParE